MYYDHAGRAYQTLHVEEIPKFVHTCRRHERLLVRRRENRSRKKKWDKKTDNCLGDLVTYRVTIGMVPVSIVYLLYSYVCMNRMHIHVYLLKKNPRGNFPGHGNCRTFCKFHWFLPKWVTVCSFAKTSN